MKSTFNEVYGAAIVKACTADAEAVGGYFSSEKPSSGNYYAVVLVVGSVFDSKGNLIRCDYHWYRENTDGTWSNKRGQTEVNCFDASGNPIYDPYTADRDYSYEEDGINYSYVVGTFYVQS